MTPLTPPLDIRAAAAAAIDAPFVLVPQYFGSLVFERATSRYLPFDHETTRLLIATRDTPIELLAARHRDPDAVYDFYDAFHARGFFGLDGRFLGQLLPVADVPEGHLVGPLAVHLEIIAACNLRCTHCFAGELPRHRNPLRIHELERLFDELALLGSYRLGLTGGEPLMRKDLFDILDAARARGLHPCLTTNALLIDDTIARELGRRDFCWLNVSLEGASPATNDPVRGAGTFEQVVARTRILARHARFTLAFTITRHNAHEVEDCARLAAELGADTVVFRPVYPTGTALEHPELMPTWHQYQDALDALERLRLPTAHTLCTLDPFSPRARRPSQARTAPGDACGAGTRICSISVEGNVNPCSFLGPAHDGGNLRHRSLREIWNESAQFAAMRAALPQTDGYRGGCRARSQASHGSAHAPDPWYALHRAAASREPLAVIELAAERPR